MTPISISGNGTPFVTSAVPATIPGAPQTLTAISNAAGSLLALWKAPVSDGGAPITGYLVQYMVDGSGSGWSTYATTTNSTTTLTLTGLTIGASYDLQVAAINSAGTGTAFAQTATPISVAASSSKSLTLRSQTLVIKALPQPGAMALVQRHGLLKSAPTGERPLPHSVA